MSLIRSKKTGNPVQAYLFSIMWVVVFVVLFLGLVSPNQRTYNPDNVKTAVPVIIENHAPELVNTSNFIVPKNDTTRYLISALPRTQEYYVILRNGNISILFNNTGLYFINDNTTRYALTEQGMIWFVNESDSQ